MTDAVLANIMKKLEGNIDDLDGLETLKLAPVSYFLIIVMKIRKWSERVLRGDQVLSFVILSNSS